MDTSALLTNWKRRRGLSGSGSGEGQGREASQAEGVIVPLTMLVPGEEAKIVALGQGAGRQHHFRRIGLREGKIVKVITTQPGRGPIVLDVEGTQLAIGRGMAQQILIQKKA
jgi:ferrous iron transport protein A